MIRTVKTQMDAASDTPMPDSTVPALVMPTMTEKHVKTIEGWELYLHALNTLTNATPEEIAKWDDLITRIREILSLVRSIVNGELVVVPRRELELWMTDPYQSVAARKEQLRRWLTPDTSKESKE
jgi:hypothetical protein